VSDGRHRIFPILIIAALSCGARAAAQEPASVQTAPARAAPEGLETPTAPVIVDGVPLFQVRGVSAYPAERRAGEIADRIAALAADRSMPAESLQIRDDTLVTSLVARGERIMGVLDADARLEGVRRGVLAVAYRTAIMDAIRRYRHDREPVVLWENLARALAATLVLALVLALDYAIARRIRAALARRHAASGLGDIRVRSVSVLSGEQLLVVLRRVVGLAGAMVALVAIYSHLSYVLLLFPWSRGAGRGLSGMLLRPLGTIGMGVVTYLPNFIFLTILALLTRYLLKAIRLFFRGVSDHKVMLPSFDPDWALPVERMMRLLVLAFALVIAYPYVPGSGSEAFKGITILLGLLFSLGSPSVIGNLVAGQSLAFRRAFRVGDQIRIGDHVGVVAEIRLLTTYLRSPKNERIVIPNSLILNGEVINYSTLAEGPGLILHTTVGIGYETPWRQVEAMLLEAAARTPGPRRQPPPFVLQKELGNFAVVYELNVYTSESIQLARQYSALHANILDLFNEYGVQIMTPAYEGDPERPKVVPPEAWSPAPAAK
jgi:small-conductance mechanosensitive channel